MAREGLPQNPVAWLVSAGRFKSIDKQRRDQRFDHLEDRPDVANPSPTRRPRSTKRKSSKTTACACLHLLPSGARVRRAGGADAARSLRPRYRRDRAAFLTPAPTIAQRIVRAKSKIRDANIPYQVPARDELPERLESVLRVVYLVFNEGYSPGRR